MSDANSLKALEEMVIRLNVQSKPHDDIVMAVCSTTGMEWNDADKYVRGIAQERGSTIHMRKLPLHLGLSLLVLLIGAGLVIINAKFFLAYAQADAAAEILSVRQAILRAIAVGTGVRMAVGGLVGLWQTLSKLGED
jgi:hypothetical protein